MNPYGALIMEEYADSYFIFYLEAFSVARSENQCYRFQTGVVAVISSPRFRKA